MLQATTACQRTLIFRRAVIVMKATCLPHRGRGTAKRWRGCASDDWTLPQSAFLTAPSWRGPRVSTHFVPNNDRGIRATKEGRKNPTQHKYHITFPGASQWENRLGCAKSVPCTKTDVCIWETFRLEKFGNPCYLIVTKRRYLNSRTSGGLPKAKVNKGNQSDFKSK